MRGKQHKWRAQQRSQVSDRTGNSVGADVTSVSRDQRLTGPLLLHLLHHGIHLMTLVLLRFLYLSLFIWQHFKKKNHAAVDVLALLSFFFVVFLSVCFFFFFFSFGFGHFWYIRWACSRPGSVPRLNMQRLLYTILHKILHRL